MTPKRAYSVERIAYRKPSLSAKRYSLTAIILIESFLFTTLFPTSVLSENSSTLRPSTTIQSSRDGGDETLGSLRDELGKFPQATTLPQFLTSALLQYPEQTLHFGKREITYRQLEEESNRFANALLSLGVQKEDRVATMLPNSNEYLIAMFGTWKVGAVLTTLKTQYKAREIKEQLAETEAKALVIFEDRLPYFEQIHRELPHLSTAILVTREDLGLKSIKDLDQVAMGRMHDLLLSSSSASPKIDVLPTDIAAIAYTSGITGKPKGVVLSHQSIVTVVDQVAAWLREAGEGPVASLVPITPTYGGNVILATLKEGRPFVSFPRLKEESGFYEEVITILDREKVAILLEYPPVS